jgi:Zinc finger, C3HC4 type (RING finger)
MNSLFFSLQAGKVKSILASTGALSVAVSAAAPTTCHAAIPQEPRLPSFGGQVSESDEYVVVEVKPTPKDGLMESLEGAVQKSQKETDNTEDSKSIDTRKHTKRIRNLDTSMKSGVDSAMAIVGRGSRLKDHFLSSDIISQDRDRAWEKILSGVRDVLSNPEVMDEMITAVRKMKPDKMQEDLISLASDSGTEVSVSDIDSVADSQQSSKKDFLPVSQQLLWEDLSGDHSCMICREMLAAPLITNCSHSFCGVCLSDHVDKVTSIDIDVVRPCPVCADPISFTTYERVLDENIAKKAATIDGGFLKVRWQDRRRQYLKSLKRSQYNFNMKTENAIQIAIPLVAIVVVMMFVMM